MAQDCSVSRILAYIQEETSSDWYDERFTSQVFNTYLKKQVIGSLDGKSVPSTQDKSVATLKNADRIFVRK